MKADREHAEAYLGVMAEIIPLTCDNTKKLQAINPALAQMFAALIIKTSEDEAERRVAKGSVTDEDRKSFAALITSLIDSYSRLGKAGV